MTDAFDRVEISQVLGLPDGPRYRVQVHRPGSATRIPITEHLENVSRDELAALGDRIWETLSENPRA